MTKVYIVRHCEALGNVIRVFQGTSDFDISETGAKQLEYLGKRFENVHIDKIYSSPLIRTVKTAEAVAGDKDIKIIKDKGLIELHGGVVEGKPFKEAFAAYPHLAKQWDDHPEDFLPANGESMRSAYNRIWETLLRLVRENNGKTIAVATHGGVTRCLMCRLNFGDIKKLKDTPWSDNTAVSLVEFDDELNPRIVYMNDSSHVPEKYMPKRNRISSFIGEK
ncbi:MAG: histidine phosphatase family protein [Clostridia bacterium]|nr:histidine phosphatase family protein [Clostridia bacterium]